MIHAKEINAAASKNKLRDVQIEKDYVLSWILYAISRNSFLSKALIFKGGTVLKKAYFQGYRFSEDLDFTLIDNKISDETLLKEFENVYAFVKEEANITLQFKSGSTHPGSGSLGFYIDYMGPLGGDIGSRDVKIDITRGETMEFSPEERKIFIEYSDLPGASFTLLCYNIAEVLIEKMAALMGRTEPRDLYDFWYLTNYEGMDTERYAPEFERKAKNKGHDPVQFRNKVLGKEGILRKGWERKLQNQVNNLPKFDDVFRESKRHFKLA